MKRALLALRNKALIYLAFIIFSFLRLTIKYRFHYPNDETKKAHEDFLCGNQQIILAFFHQDELSLMPYYSYRKLYGMISLSKDGSMMAKLVSLFGYVPIRGSSSRGAVGGLIATIKAARAGASIVFAVDGPKGPIYKVKEGVIALSDKTRVKILPAVANPSKAKIFEKAWNKAMLPYPFSTIDVYFSEFSFYKIHELEQTLCKLKSSSLQSGTVSLKTL